MKSVASLKIGQSHVVAGQPLIWIGLSSALFQLLRSQGLTPQTLHKMDLAFTENKTQAVKQAQRIAEQEGGSPLLVGVEDTEFNIDKYDMRQKSPYEIVPSKAIPFEFLKIMHMS